MYENTQENLQKGVGLSSCDSQKYSSDTLKITEPTHEEIYIEKESKWSMARTLGQGKQNFKTVLGGNGYISYC